MEDEIIKPPILVNFTGPRDFCGNIVTLALRYAF